MNGNSRFNSARAAQISGIAIHAEDRFGDNDLHLPAIRFFQEPAKLAEMNVRKDSHRRAGGAHRIDERSMDELVENEPHAASILRDGGERLDRGEVRLVSAGQQHTRLRAFPRGDGFLGGAVKLRVSADQPRRPAAGAMI